MKKPPAVAGNTMRWIALALLAVPLACTVANPPAPERIPLPPGVNPNATAFRNGIQASYPVTGTHDRPRPGNCSKCLVIVHIDVLGDTRRVDADNPPTAPAGIAIAHLVNRDNRDNEAYFNLRPYTVADYYVWVDDNGGRKARYTLLELVGNTVTATKQWNVKKCHQYSTTYPPGPSDFDFYEFKHPGEECDKAYSTGMVGANHASFFTVSPFRHLFTRMSAIVRGEIGALPGSWIECSSGCCT
jgi:hypothetical protein